jgi:ribosomal protein S27AE
MNSNDRCVRCGSTQVIREHKDNGIVRCLRCNLSLIQRVWNKYGENKENFDLGDLIDLCSVRSAQDEIVNRSRTKEFSGMLKESFNFKDNGTLDIGEDRLVDVGILVSNYIGSLETRKEIPPGLYVEEICRTESGQLQVKFGILRNTTFEDRNYLVGFLTGRLTFL